MTVPDKQLFTHAAKTVSAWRRPLLISHAKPDGDALGSLVAMRSLLASQGIEATALLFEALPSRYTVFNRFAPMPVLNVDMRDGDLSDRDGVILLDTCTYSQLEPIADWLRTAEIPKLAVDHHVTRDDLVNHYLIDESAAATCLILYDWAQVLGWQPTPEAAEAMFIGMAMDTGWFIHSNTDTRVLAASADLVSRGVCASELHEHLFHRDSPARVRLLGSALNTLELLTNDRLAVMTLSSNAIQEAGATPADTEDIVNEPLRIGSVVVSVMLVESEGNLVRVSFRSKPPVGAGSDTQVPDIDVAGVAHSFGGGGHKRAAGARMSGTLADVRKQIVSRLESALRDH